jgi:hypothetical protein
MLKANLYHPPLLMLFVGLLFLLPAARADVEVEFIPALYSHRLSAESYQNIWTEYGAQIIESLERHTCLPFVESKIGAIIDDAESHSGGPEYPIQLRATYPEKTKMATLVHELGHRHLWQLENRLEDVDGHQTLYLILDRVWADVWGEAFAAESVAVESQWFTDYDYAGAWSWARALSDEERAELWNKLLAINGFDSPCSG